MWILAAVLSWMSVLVGALLISIVRSAQLTGGMLLFQEGRAFQDAFLGGGHIPGRSVSMRWIRVLTIVGVHAEGEYAKVVTGGIVDVPRKTMSDKLRYLRVQDEELRKFLPEIRGIGIKQFTGPLKRRGRGLTARNTVAVSPGCLDRSPCGTGASARLAVMHARRQIRKGQRFDHSSIVGTHFLAEVVATTWVGHKPAVVTTVAGLGYVTRIGQYGVDPDDPLPEGHTLSDTWLKTVSITPAVA
jgi:proline racemase